MYPFVMAGLLGLWVLIAMAIACSPKLAAIELENTGAAAYVSCRPAGSQVSLAPGQLLRCEVDPGVAPAREI